MAYKRETKTACQQVRDLQQRHIRYWQPRWESIKECRAFVLGDRYEEDNGTNNRDRRLTQIHGQETTDTIRHLVASSTAKARSVEPKPVDNDVDPDTSEIAVALVELETGDPMKMFDDCLESAIAAAREARVGFVMMDWEPDDGPFGNIQFREGDSLNMMWDPAYHPHHAQCGWLIEKRRLDADLVNSTYGVDWVKPDRVAMESYSSSDEMRPGIPVMRGANGERVPADATAHDDEKATVWFCWYKNDATMKKAAAKKVANNLQDPLNPDDRYLACDNKCGYRSATQGELKIAGKVQNELPQVLEGSCPKCGQGDLIRVDVKSEPDYVQAYTNGRRLVILTPCCPGPDDAPLYDDSWPIPTARSFPLFFITAYQKPLDQVGPCDVDLMWDQQIASDNLRTLALQRVLEHRAYFVLPSVGINDGNGERFMFRDDQFNVMYRDGSLTGFGPLDVQVINSTGLDPGWQVAFSATQQALVQYRGVTDLGLTQENTKNIAASTVQQLNQLGEIPLAHFIRRKNRALSQFYGVLWDYIRATYTPKRLARLRLDGLDLVDRLYGDDLPNFDFRLEDTPDFAGLDKARADAFQVSLQMINDPATEPYFDIFAEMNNLPRSVVKKIQKRKDQLDQKAKMMKMLGMDEPTQQPAGGKPQKAGNQQPAMAGA